MTTAARPTFEPARGGRGKGDNDLSSLSKQYSSRDLPSHNKLKYRQDGQGSIEELRNRDFRKDLEDRERAAREKKDRGRESGGSSSSSSSKRLRLEPASNLDADDPVDDEDEESDSEDDDDTMELMEELKKIKKERLAEAAKLEAERKVEEERIRKENILKGNPLLNQEKIDFKVKRRWDDDVVFKNCAKGGDDRKGRGFINDTLRSEFHKKFMEKYVK
ncbi:spliceosome-associated protein CWC15 homolog [Octopus vulgaris]|uniref:Spliceosome-associated protein CWC15 homolog n=2 Tax=Octopus TaxID=6643 RepID=A0AA36BMC5_OCTVU|nr:spliceosome-associated protein CWC15 homolog [Octopus sinensis]CAI9736953.1 spliceosome-associated protein CWC15 homolog [Octopus vulgaris]